MDVADFYAMDALYSGDPLQSQSVGISPDSSGAPMMAGDVADYQQMNAWNPPAAQAQGMTWWEGIAKYGITRAIDNTFPGSPVGTMGNIYPGSMAGIGGRTVGYAPGGVNQAAAAVSVKGNPLMLLLIAAGIFLVLK